MAFAIRSLLWMESVIPVCLKQYINTAQSLQNTPRKERPSIHDVQIFIWIENIIEKKGLNLRFSIIFYRDCSLLLLRIKTPY